MDPKPEPTDMFETKDDMGGRSMRKHSHMDASNMKLQGETEG